MVSIGPLGKLPAASSLRSWPVAEEEVWVMLIEPATTLNTGDTEDELTKHILDKK